jgi:Flp pilus assembly protein TadB
MVNWFRKKKRKISHDRFYSVRMFEPSIESREFKLFKEKEKREFTWFERLARLSGRILSVNPDENTRKNLENSIAFTGLQITPKDVMALLVLTIMFFVTISIILVVSGFIPLVGALFLSVIGIGLAYYFLKYPENLLKSYRIKASSQVVLAILYMVVSMRVSPNLEQALRFAAANVSGPLAWDMRRLLWDVEMGKYYSASHALTDYIAKWKPENEEFAEALRLIRDSLTHTGERVDMILDEALDVILDGTKVRMKHYAQELSMPVTIIHMMGIILPVLGSVMAPMAAIFLSDIVKAEYFIVGYNIILPIFIVWFINSVLKKRPTTFSEVDISTHPDLPPKGSFYMRFGGKKVALPVLPISLIVALIFLVPALYYFSSNPYMLFPSQGVEVKHTVFSLVMSCLITMGVAFSLSSYFLLSNFQRINIQGDIQKTESEFELALFQLGNRIAGGTPTEVALEKSINDVKDLSICGLFTIALRNIKNLGMTFKDALFNKKFGAIRYYPSKLIKNIMYMIVDIAKKGVKYAADGMLTVAKYLRNIRETQEYIRDLLQESVSSMTFQAYLLTPMITGLIVSMSQIIINVLSILTNRLQGMSTGSAFTFMNFTGGLFGTGGATPAVSPEMFQLIIGVYLIEVIIILAIFITKITQGENKVFQWYLAGKMLTVATITYFLVALGSSLMFSGLIEQAILNI